VTRQFLENFSGDQVRNETGSFRHSDRRRSVSLKQLLCDCLSVYGHLPFVTHLELKNGPLLTLLTERYYALCTLE